MYIMHLFNKIPSCRPPQLGAWAGFLFFFLFFSAFFIHPRPAGSERREKELSLGSCREQVLDFRIWGKRQKKKKRKREMREGILEEKQSKKRRKWKKQSKDRGVSFSWDRGFWEILSAWGRVRENWEEEFESHGEAVSKKSYREVISSWAEEELLWAEEELLVLVQVFSMLDTQSLCYTAATCTMFHKSAMDSLCYATIDLTTIVPKVNNAAVFTMTQWVGKVLR